jgi:arabinose-5-phosphate isomerase
MKNKSRHIGQDVINKEAQALAAVQLDEQFDDAVEMILKRNGDVIVLGVGKSGHIAKKVAASLTSLGIKSIFIHPAEAGHGDLGSITKTDVCIIFSHSGNTKEIAVLLPYIDAPIIAITSNKESKIGKRADAIIQTHVSTESSRLDAPTTSSTVSLAIGDALAVALAEQTNFSIKDFARNHPLGSLGRKMTPVEKIMKPKDKLALVKKETSVLETMQVITEKRTGQAYVVEGDVLVGIITDGDIRRAIIQTKNNLHKKAEDIMKKDPKKIKEGKLMKDAQQKMQKDNIRCLPVIDVDHKIIGSIEESEEE